MRLCLRTFLVFIMPLIPLTSYTQSARSMIQVQATNDIESLVRDVFIKEGECSKVSNIKPIGRLEGIGSFTTDSGSIVLGIESGIVLSTGNIEDIVGPNERNNTTGFGILDSSDEDLRRISSNQVFDATGIEFDFTPTTQVVTFSYVFASEEYCEFVNQEFNDVFGFFVSGPGINGRFQDNGVNVALIPGTEERVAINSVNHLRNSQFFISNFRDEDLLECQLTPTFEPLRDFEFDGFTVKLTARIEVVPCETYHIRLVVGDVADNILDSGVFLEAKSFDLGENIGVSSNVINSDGNILYEDCLEGEFIFERKTLVNRARPININYQINGSAQNGVDYEMIPGQITIPVGERFSYLPIRGILDNVSEGLEKIEIVTEVQSCDCVERDTAFLFIEDNNTNLAIEFEEELVCEGQEFSIQPNVFNGIPPLIYQWSNGDTSLSLSDQINTPQQFSLTVTDACGSEETATIDIGIQAPPNASLSGETSWCPGQTSNFLPIVMEGNGPWSVEYQVNDTARFSIDSIESNPFLLPVNQAGTYQLISFNDRNCSGFAEGNGIVERTGFALNAEITDPSCKNTSDGRIELVPKGGVGPYQAIWDIPVRNPLVRPNVGAGSYLVSVQDAEGCIEEALIDIPMDQLRDRCPFSKKMIYIPTAFSPNGDEVNDLFQVYPRNGTIRSLSLDIYDRWGGKIYSSGFYTPFDRTVGWDGAGAGIGVYLCRVTFELSDGRLETLASEVHLIR